MDLTATSHYDRKTATGPIYYYETPDDPCRAVCAACDYHCQREEWAGWTRLDPATLDGVDPTHCEHCGAPIPAEA